VLRCCFTLLDAAVVARMVGQPGFFDMSHCLRRLSAKGDDLARIAALVAFAPFRPTNEKSRPLRERLTQTH